MTKRRELQKAIEASATLVEEDDDVPPLCIPLADHLAHIRILPRT